MRVANSLLALAALLAFADAVSVDERVNCKITGSAPTRPPSLSFCHKFNNLACCTPGQDATIAGNFAELFGE